MYMNIGCLASAAECLPSGVSNSLLRVLKKLSAQALSRQFLFRLVLCLTAARPHAQFGPERGRAVLHTPAEMKNQTGLGRRFIQSIASAGTVVCSSVISPLKSLFKIFSTGPQ
jgi:hypothetical protein